MGSTPRNNDGNDVGGVAGRAGGSLLALSRSPLRSPTPVALVAAAIVGMMVLVMVLSSSLRAFAAEPPVGLGTAASYSVLGGQTVTNTGPTVLAGNLGVSPGSAAPGFPPGRVGGTTHLADAQSLKAQADLAVAFDDASGRAPTANVSGDLVGRTLPGGVYKSTGPLALSGTVTLDGGGNASTVFIFQVASTLITASSARVVLTGAAQSCNVFWQVGSSATLGTGTAFAGNVLALTSITAETGSTISGRLLARNGQVSLDTNVVSSAACATATPTATPTPTPTGNPTGTPTDVPTATAVPTANPSGTPTAAPTPLPTGTATATPTGTPTGTPTATPPPTGGATVPPGTPTPTPTASSPAAPGPSPSAPPVAVTPPTPPTRGGGGEGALANTGTDAWMTVGLGGLAVVLLIAGAVLVGFRRRHRG